MFFSKKFVPQPHTLNESFDDDIKFILYIADRKFNWNYTSKM